jgi:hypothetical protein
MPFPFRIIAKSYVPCGGKLSRLEEEQAATEEHMSVRYLILLTFSSPGKLYTGSDF